MITLSLLEGYRMRAAEIAHWGMSPEEEGGMFQVPVDGKIFNVVATIGGGWDHVSVSLRGRCPTYEEMDKIKRIFFRADETAMQLHVPPSDHISIHPYTLHLWRPTDAEIPLPPKEYV